MRSASMQRKAKRIYSGMDRRTSDFHVPYSQVFEASNGMAKVVSEKDEKKREARGLVDVLHGRSDCVEAVINIGVPKLHLSL